MIMGKPVIAFMLGMMIIAGTLHAAPLPGSSEVTSTQTNWSGGPGMAGPVFDWGNRFDSETGIDWRSTPGELTLGITILDHPIETLVTDDFYTAQSVCAADLDGDGDDDFLGAAYLGFEISWWENLDGSGTNLEKHIIREGFDRPFNAIAADVDGDGDLDVAAAAYLEDRILWWENLDGLGTDWQEHLVDNNIDDVLVLASEDMDGDGDIDFLCGGYDYDSSGISWWENETGRGTAWTRHVVDATVEGIAGICAGDIDGDGDMDVVATDYFDHDVIWWENRDGAGNSWSEILVNNTFPFAAARHVAAADVDGDGDNDILAVGLLADQVAWFENDNGDGSAWTWRTIVNGYTGSSSVYPVDMDDDGDIDVLSTAHWANSVDWWENRNGSGMSWERHKLNWMALTFADSVCPGDFNGDGNLDVAAVSLDQYSITWWQVFAYPDSGSMVSSILYTNDDPEWGVVDWDATVPGGSSLSFQVRSSDDQADLGPWSGPITTPGELAGTLADHDSYLQYRVDFQTTDPAVTPMLDRFEISWTSTDQHIHPGLAVGPGPGYDNPPLVRLFPPEQDAAPDLEITAYGVPHYGVNVSSGDLNGDGMDDILTGAGPGDVFGPHARGFLLDGTPLPGLSFLAYGTNRHGVNVSAGDLDNDGIDEIITGAGPGAVFGPHVRAFGYNGSAVSPVAGVSYFAYGTLKFGVNVTAGDIDGDGFDEIVTGAGPGAVFGPHVRGWNVDGGTAGAISGVSFLAYGTNKYGVNVAAGDLDGDGIDEMITAPGPSSLFGAHIRGWNYDGDTLAAMPGCSFFAWQPSEAMFGAQVSSGTDLDRDGRDELVVGAGPDPSMGSQIRVYHCGPSQSTLWFGLEAFDAAMTYGANGTAVGF